MHQPTLCMSDQILTIVMLLPALGLNQGALDHVLVGVIQRLKETKRS